MKGTEKQVKWAEDIKVALLDMCRAAAEQEKAAASTWNALAGKIETVDKAWELIDAFGTIRFTADPLANFNAVMKHSSARDYLRGMMQ